MGRESRLRWAVALCALLAAMAGAQWAYMRRRPVLRPEHRSAAERQSDLHYLKDLQGDNRATVAAVREYLLDHPDMNEPELSFKLIEAVASGNHPDWLFVADELEWVSGRVLASSGPERLAQLMGLDKSECATFATQKFDRWSGSMVLADVDGDGSQDVLVTYPRGDAGVCCLWRHTRTGWVCHRLSVGAAIKSLWVFDVAPHGPRAIDVVSIGDSEYRPTMFVDVFVWRDHRVTNVLSTTLPNGFQMDHRDVDGSGRQAIRLFGDAVPGSYRDNSPRTLYIYQWDGREYRLHETRSLVHKLTASQEAAEGYERFDRGQYAAAERLLLAALALDAGQKAPQDPFSGESKFSDGERNRLWWDAGLCLALRGDQKGAAAAMAGIKETRDEPSDYALPAHRFLEALKQGGDLPRALAVCGQGLRLLELAVRKAKPDSTPQSIFAGAGLALGRMQHIEVAGHGVMAGVGQVMWPGGNAVMAVRQEGVGKSWRMDLLAYGRTDRPVQPPSDQDNPFRGPVTDLFYLPQAPALQLYPPATSVRFDGVRQDGSVSAPVVEMTYRQEGKEHTGAVRWNGQRFAVEGAPQSAEAEDFELTLNRIEAQLFSGRDYKGAREAFEALDQRIHPIAHSAPAQDAVRKRLLLEIYYHEALCWRKQGQRQRAAVIYAALQRTDLPEGSSGEPGWGELAHGWLAQ